MRFLVVDECTGPAVAQWLRTQGHEIFSVYDQAPGSSGDQVVQKAYAEDWILVTNDKDFGEKVFREGMPHHGVVFLRLADERSANKIETIRRLLAVYADRLLRPLKADSRPSVEPLAPKAQPPQRSGDRPCSASS